MDLKGKKILLTGGAGFLGHAVLKKLLARGVLENDIKIPRSAADDLRKKEICDEVVEKRDLVIHVAGAVGGLGFVKNNPATAFYDNAAMSLHLIDAAYNAGVKKFVGIGSVCEYPNVTPLPFNEDDLWNGYPAEDLAAYGIAKRMMLAQSLAYRKQYGFNAIHLLMINLFGPGDGNFDRENSHVISAIIRKVAEVKKTGKDFIELWGAGKASREFLYVDDAAEAIVLAAEKYDKPEPVNIGSGREVPIKELAEIISRLMDFRGELRWDASKPEGQARRQLNITRAELEFGFEAKSDFEEGLRKTIEWYLGHGK